MILDFLTTAKLGCLHLGLTESEVRHELGEPEDRSLSTRAAEIWKYGSLEVAFHNGLLSFIGLYFESGALKLPSSLFEAEIVTIDSSVEGIGRLLHSNEIDFKIDEDLTFDDQLYLRVKETKIGICFVNGHLHSIQLPK